MIGYDYSKFNWNDALTKKHLDMDVYNKKFEMADKFFFQEKNPHPQVAQALLTDRTIRCYLKFKINNKPLRLYPFQDLIINDNSRFRYFRAANQIGKSLLIDAESADDLTLDHGYGHNAAIVSATLKQATFQMIRIKDLLNSANIFDWREEKGEVDNMSMVTWDVPDKEKPKRDGKYQKKYTNRIIVVPAGEGILGFDLHHLYLDEFEFWKDIDLKWFVNQLAEPRTYATNGRMTFATNPNGSDNYGTVLETLTLPNGNRKYHSYIFSYLDRPGATEEDLELAKAGKTRMEIESTLMAIRSISDDNYFTADEIERSYDKNLSKQNLIGKQPFAFLDVGAKHDQSVFAVGYIEFPDGDDNLPHAYIPIIHAYPVGYPLSRVVGSKADDSDGWHYEKSVREYLEEWKQEGLSPQFGFDITGNQGMLPLLESVNLSPIDVTFSGPVKSGMYQRLKYYMEKGLLHRIRNEQFEHQFAHLVMKKSQRGYFMIHHDNERELDDVPDAVAGLLYLMDPVDIKNIKSDFKVI